MKWSPKRIHIEISTLCNSNCVTCPHCKIKRTKVIDVARIKKLITEEMKEYQGTLELIEFHNYNEPLLTPKIFFELTDLANQTFGFGKVGLVTNGSVMTPEIADQILDCKLKHILFSIDGFSKEVFERIRQGLDRDTVYKNVEYFIERSKLAYGVVPDINFVVTRENRHEVETARQYFEKLRCHFWITGCNGRGGSGKEAYMVDSFVPEPCDYALDGVWVLSNLDVVPCCNDWSGIEVMGNLKKSSLKEVLEGTKYEGFRTLQYNHNKLNIGLCHFCRTNLSYKYSDLLRRY
jgi:MoaA/NifB/PqqE/SkfB family radical SAM enzyme